MLSSIRQYQVVNYNTRGFIMRRPDQMLQRKGSLDTLQGTASFLPQSDMLKQLSFQQHLQFLPPRSD